MDNNKINNNIIKSNMKSVYVLFYRTNNFKNIVSVYANKEDAINALTFNKNTLEFLINNNLHNNLKFNQYIISKTEHDQSHTFGFRFTDKIFSYFEEYIVETHSLIE